jgi:hypothetical protein
MIDRIFSALLTFCLLAGGTAAIGSALFEDAPATQTATAITLPTVEITGTREPASSPIARNEITAEPTARQLQ